MERKKIIEMIRNVFFAEQRDPNGYTILEMALPFFDTVTIQDLNIEPTHMNNTVIEFIITNNKVSFSESSATAGDTFEKVTQNYARKYYNRHDPIPDFLMYIIMLCGKDNTKTEKRVKR